MYREKIREALEAKRAEAQAKWGEFEKLREAITGSDVDPFKNKDAFEKAHEAQKDYSLAKQECDELFKQYEQAVEMDGAVKPGDTPFSADETGNGNGNGSKRDMPPYIWGPNGELIPIGNGKASKTPGELFADSEQIKKLQESGVLSMEKSHVHSGPVEVLDRENVKTLLTGGGAPGTQLLRAERLPGILPLLLAPLQISGLVTVGSTDSNVIEWVRESAIANNAAEVAEATATTGTSGTKPESGMTFVIENTPVQTIAHWIPATKQALEDMPQLRTLVDGMLTDGVARRLNSQILNGNGTAPNLKGILATAGIGTQAFTVDMLETMLRGITQSRLAFFEPTAILMNPADYISMRLLKFSGSGEYMFGPPSQEGLSVAWGVPIITDPLQAAGFVTIGDWRQAILYVRSGVTVIATDSHSDFFVRNLVAILAEGRYGLAVPRPQAFVNADIVTP
jgi:HK97 family phage major capsid protein